MARTSSKTKSRSAAYYRQIKRNGRGRTSPVLVVLVVLVALAAVTLAIIALTS